MAGWWRGYVHGNSWGIAGEWRGCNRLFAHVAILEDLKGYVVVVLEKRMSGREE